MAELFKTLGLMFFFAKKNQKTLASLEDHGQPAVLHRCARMHAAWPQRGPVVCAWVRDRRAKLVHAAPG